ncbi:GFA family protein [Tateyamaria sp. SN3-11]|uniref:GFA family protein n=1 Tax=Tateyamaria sp. SN3-11 TaxID=3092147 RepID=UPI0039E930FC
MADDKTTRSGGCMCGAVRFDARNVPSTYGICHCPMCRRWTGSALLGVDMKTEDVTWHGTDNIAVRASSAWAERAWCKTCGTNLYFRHTKRDKWFGYTELPLGLFDDPGRFTLSHEIYVDQKPASFAYVGEGHKQLTRADVVAANPDVDDTA